MQVINKHKDVLVLIEDSLLLELQISQVFEGKNIQGQELLLKLALEFNSLGGVRTNYYDVLIL